MGIEDYDPVRDNNKDIYPGDISISGDPLRRDVQTIDAIRQLMADLAVWSGGFGGIVSGSWTPELSFATPGDVAVVYTVRVGHYSKIGKTVTLWFRIATSAFTWSTAAGEFRINGKPFASDSALEFTGPVEAGVFTVWGVAGYTCMNVNISNTGVMRLVGTKENVSRAAIQFNDMTSGTNIVLIGSITYEATE